MTNVDVVQILQIGVIGLGFLLALLAFWLLRNEQHKQEPNSQILKNVSIFMFFSMVLCVIGLAAQLLPETHFDKQRIVELEGINQKLAEEAERFGKTCEHIRTTNWLDEGSEARKSLSQWCYWSHHMLLLLPNNALQPMCDNARVWGRALASKNLGEAVSVCKYCGQPAGFLRSKHADCEQKHTGAVRQIGTLVSIATIGHSSLESLKSKLQSIAQANHVGSAELNEIAIRAWESAVDHFLNDGNLDESEEKRLIELSNHFGFSQSDLDERGAYTKVVKAAVLRDLMSGVIPTRALISGAPFNLQKNEQIVWLFSHVDYLEDKIRHQYVGTSRGVSVRIMKGVY
jgi:hypothetical protein